MSFESFPLPAAYGEAGSGGGDGASLTGKLRRFFVGSSAASSLSSQDTVAAPISDGGQRSPRPTPTPVQQRLREAAGGHPSPSSTRPASRLSFDAQSFVDDTLPDDSVSLRTGYSRKRSNSIQSASGFPLGLSGVAAPSVKISRTNSHRGDFVSRLGANELGRSTNSPTMTEWSPTLANLTSIPGFPLAKDVADDTRSIRSVSTVAKPQVSLQRIFRQLRREGLSKEYWIRDESSKECFDCQTLFTTFRRKHHCRICGQIFCASCASNIISSTRFGHQGFVRVCNLCMAIMEDSDALDTPSNAASKAPMRSSLESSTRPIISAPLEASARQPQSQFAASFLFPRAESVHNHALFEAHHNHTQQNRKVSPASTRANTPFEDQEEEDAMEARSRRSPGGGSVALPRNTSFSSGQQLAAAAPFRRRVLEDDKAQETMTNGGGASEARAAGDEEGIPQVVEPDTPPEVQVAEEGHALTSPNLAGEYATFSPQSAAAADEESPSARARTDSVACPIHPDMGLGSGCGEVPSSTPNEAAICHIRRLLRQSLEAAQVPDVDAWQEALQTILLSMKFPSPDLKSGDCADVRKYIRIKRIPGGLPQHSEYVDGVTFTKNILHKQMSRFLVQPRIMLLSIPLEYQRVKNQFMSLERLLNQEKEYLHNLVSRIAALRPHIVLVESNVSGLALDYLREANIAVARNVKPSAIDAVARATQADIISSIDKLALEPRLGQCRSFRIQTFDSPLIPGQRKSVMRFEGCRDDLTSSLILRGGTMETLSKIKEILRTMLLVVYNAKLEAALFHDEFAISTVAAAEPPPAPAKRRRKAPPPMAQEEGPASEPAVKPAEQDSTYKSLEPYSTLILSASPSVQYPAPYPLVKANQTKQRLESLKLLKDHEETEQIIRDEEASRQEAVDHAAGRRLERRSLQLVDDPAKVIRGPDLLANASNLVEAETQYASQVKTSERYLKRVGSAVVQDHQSITVLETLACQHTTRPCTVPTMRTVRFYDREDDITIGQYIERTCREAGRRCVAKACDSPMMAHYSTWVHLPYRVTIVPEVHQVELEQPEFENRILMYNYCKRCEKATPQVPMSDNTYRLSLFKYLELSFYPQHLKSQMPGCPHNAHVDLVRFWQLNQVCLQVAVEEIEGRDILPPALSLQVRPDKQLQLRNDEFYGILRKSTTFWDSVANRISTFNYKHVDPDRLEAARLTLEELLKRSELDRRAVSRQLINMYDQGMSTNGTEMTAVRRTLQNKAVEWENEFQTFEQTFVPAEKDTRRLTAAQLKRLVSDTVPLSPDRKLLGSGVLASLGLVSDDGKDDREMGLIPEISIPDSALPLEPIALKFVDDASSELSSVPSSLTSEASTPSEFSFASAGASVSSPLTESPPALKTVMGSPVGQRAASPESDSTVCADEPQARSPFMQKRIEDTTSDQESESDFARSVPKRSPFFPQLPGISSRDGGPDGSSADGMPSQGSRRQRPSLRKGQTERTVPTNARMTAPSQPFSDSDDVDQSKPPVRVPRPLLRRAPSTAKRPASHSVTRDLQPPISTILAGEEGSRSQSVPPPTAEVVTKAEGTNKLAKAPPARHSSGSKAALKGKSKIPTAIAAPTSPRMSFSKPSKDFVGTSSRPTRASGIKATMPRRAASASYQAASSNSSRVSTIARHFDKLSQEAEKDQRRKFTLRGRRARPVAVANPIVTAFDNWKDAIKEESESEDSDDARADDEYEGDKDDPEDDHAEEPPTSMSASNMSQATEKPPEPCTPPVDDLATPTTLIVDALMQHHQNPNRSDATRPPSPVVTRQKNIDESGSSAPGSLPQSPTRADGFSLRRFTSDSEQSGTERSSFIRSLANLYSVRGCEFAPLDYPLLPGEHLFEDNPVLVREDEPSTILAFTLSSRAYHEKLKEDNAARHVVEHSEAFEPGESHPQDQSSTWDVVDIKPEATTDVDEALRRPTATHLRLQFEEGTTTFYCKIFFAEQFDALRKNCGCDAQFIESLARCFKWNSSGGKSKADFFKSKDDRFIIKEVSRLEIDALLKFAPDYFEYMSKAFSKGLPTTLAKIYGFFRIGLRNTTTGKAFRMDVLVIENLFYAKTITQVFDLKGSTRNRHVQISENKPNEVLMDENLLQMSLKDPLYVREESKRFIRAAVYNDSLFLCNMNVVDYSLVVGKSSTGELVVGIVDFIRTYTWDKRVENWVKESTFLGGGSSKTGGPTIVTPKQYKKRFREAMEGYFLLAPDPWVCASSSLPIPKCSNAATGEDQEVFVDADGQPLLLLTAGGISAAARPKTAQ